MRILCRSSAVTHGFLLNFGTLTTLDFPATGTTSTMALGLNDKGQVVGVYMVGTAMHGFVYNSTNGHFHSVDDPKGVGSTTINGINNGRLSVLSRLERTHGRLYRHAFVGQRRRFPVFKDPRSRRDGYRQPADSARPRDPPPISCCR